MALIKENDYFCHLKPKKTEMMLYKLIPPPSVKATIQLPASKSISNRALIINALGKGIYSPENLSDCDDTQVMIKALTEGQETIDIMAAGTAMRFLTAYLSVTPGERVITGTARMQQRPIQILVNALRELGARNVWNTSTNGSTPSMTCNRNTVWTRWKTFCE